MVEMNNSKRDQRKDIFLPPLFFFCLSLLINFRLLFARGSIGFRHDWMIPYFAAQSRAWLNQIFFAWDRTSLGVPVTPKMWVFRRAIIGLFYLMGLSGETGAKLLLIVFIFFSGLSAYFLCRNVRINKRGAYFAGIFYMASPIIFNRTIAGHLDYLLSYSLSPFAMGYFIKSIDSERDRFFNALAAGLFYSLASIQLQFVPILFLIYTSYLLYSIVTDRKKIAGRVSSFVFTISVFVAIYLPGIILSIITKETTSLRAIRQTNQQLALQSPSLIESFRLIGYISPYFERAVNIPSLNWVWIIISFIIPLSIFSAFYFRRNNPRIMYFLVLLIFALLFVKGVNAPLGSIFAWSFKQIWIMPIFSEVYHLMPLAALPMMVLLGFFLGELSQSISTKERKLLITLSSVALVIFLWPLFTGNYMGEVQTFTLNHKYKELCSELSSNPENIRILWLPMNNPMSYNNSPHAGMDPLIGYWPKPSPGNYFPWTSPSINYILFLTATLHDNKTKYLGDLLSLANIQKIVLRSDYATKVQNYFYTFRQPDIYSRYSDETKFIDSLLSRQEDLVLEKNNPPYKMFDNIDNNPHLYLAKDSAMISGDLSTLVSMSYFDRLYRKNASFFAPQLNAGASEKILNRTNTIVFKNNNLEDLRFSMLPDNYKIDPGNYVSKYDPKTGWASGLFWWWYKWNYTSSLEKWVFTQKDDVLKIPIKITEDSPYDLWVKAYFCPSSSRLDIKVDGEYVDTIQTKTVNEVGFKWIKLKLIYLDSGVHRVEIQSANGEEAISRIVLAPLDSEKKSTAKTGSLIADKKLIIINEAENLSPNTPVWEERNSFNEWKMSTWWKDKPKKAKVVTSGNSVSLKLSHSPFFRDEGLSFIRTNLSVSFEQKPFLFIRYRIKRADFGSKFFINLKRDKFASYNYHFAPFKKTHKWTDQIIDLSFLNWDKISFIGFGLHSKFPGSDEVEIQKVVFVNSSQEQNTGEIASCGAFIDLKAPTKAVLEQQIPVSGKYELYMRCQAAQINTAFSLIANGRLFELAIPKQKDFTWVRIGTIYFRMGKKDIGVNVQSGNLLLDSIVLKKNGRISTLNNSYLGKEKNISRVSSSAIFNCKSPSYLIYAENFNDSWRAEGNTPTLVNSFANAFFINKKGIAQLKIAYVGQKMYTFALIWMIFIVAACTVYLIYYGLKTKGAKEK